MDPLKRRQFYCRLNPTIPHYVVERYCINIHRGLWRTLIGQIAYANRIAKVFRSEQSLSIYWGHQNHQSTKQSCLLTSMLRELEDRHGILDRIFVAVSTGQVGDQKGDAVDKEDLA